MSVLRNPGTAIVTRHPANPPGTFKLFATVPGAHGPHRVSIDLDRNALRRLSLSMVKALGADLAAAARRCTSAIDDDAGARA